MEITASELKQNLGKYLDMAHDGEEIIITKNDKVYTKLVTAKTDRLAALHRMVGALSDVEFPPEGEDPKLDRILRNNTYVKREKVK